LENWDGWELGRVILVFAAILLTGIWVQLSLMHWAGAFRRWEMYAPVFVSPIVVLCLLLGVVSRDGVLGWIAFAGAVAVVLEGLAGFFFHERAMLAQVSGLSVRNLIAGPPPVLPLAYSLTGLLALIGLLWDA
jgi:hypothetical protein